MNREKYQDESFSYQELELIVWALFDHLLDDLAQGKQDILKAAPNEVLELLFDTFIQKTQATKDVLGAAVEAVLEARED